MATNNGWLNSISLLASAVKNLGTSVHQALAGELPEAEIERIEGELDREFGKISTELARARADAARERNDVVQLKARIASDMGAAVLAEKANDEAALNELVSGLETMNAQLLVEQEESRLADETVGEIEKIFNSIKLQKQGFAAKAKQALQQKKLAEKRVDVAQMQEDRAKRVSTLASGAVDTSTAFGALDKVTAELNIKAEAARLRTEGQTGTMAASADKYRQQAAGVQPASSLSERLAALKGNTGNDQKAA
jgi:hypothetical protein